MFCYRYKGSILDAPASYFEAIKRANHDYNRVSGMMEIRNTIYQDSGVEWGNSKNKDRILFAYKSFKYSAPGIREVLDITTNETVSKEGFTTKPYRTYLIKR